jgi:predicted TIM-barrel fold metal-dependent hydrolase
MLELEHGFRVVDVHARLSVDEDVAARGRMISPDRLEREMRQAGVVRAVVVPETNPQSSYLQYNNAVARLSVERPFVAFARLSGPRSVSDSATNRLRSAVARRDETDTDPEEIEQYAYDDRFHGFVMDPAKDGLPDDETLDELEAVDLPVLVPGGQGFPPERIAETLLHRSFPTIVGHFGGHPLQRDLMDGAIDLLGEYDGYYLDTSLVRYREPLERALLEHPDRVCFGSGAPASHPNVGVMELLTLDVSEDKLRRAFDRNPSRVIDALAAHEEGTPVG